MYCRIPVNTNNYYKAVLTILNFDLKASEFELDILCSLFKHKTIELNTETRELIRQELGKDKFIMNNYIKRLKDKNILIDRGIKPRTYIVNPTIIEAINDGRLEFEFVVIKEENTKTTTE